MDECASVHSELAEGGVWVGCNDAHRRAERAVVVMYVGMCVYMWVYLSTSNLLSHAGLGSAGKWTSGRVRWHLLGFPMLGGCDHLPRLHRKRKEGEGSAGRAQRELAQGHDRCHHTWHHDDWLVHMIQGEQ